MVAEGLTQREMDRLYGVSVIPAVAIFIIAIFYYSFVHLERIYPPESLMLDALVNLFPFIMIGGSAAFFLTFEILYAQRVKKPATYHAKRWIGRMATVLISIMLFFVIFLASYFLLVPVISEGFGMLLGFGIWLVALGLVITRFKHVLTKLDKGEW